MKAMDLNDILIIAVIVLGLVINAMGHENSYLINNYAIIFSNILCVQVIIILVIAKRKNNQLLTYLGLFIVIFYLLRVVTLILFDPNPYLKSFRLSANDYEYTLKVIIIYFPIMAISTMVGSRTLKRPKSPIRMEKQINNIKTVILIAYAGFVPHIFTMLNVGLFSTIGSALRTYFPLSTIFLVTMAYYLTNRSFLKSNQKLSLHIYFFIYVSFNIFLGNKSAVYNFAIAVIIGVLAINGSIKVQFKTILSSLILLIASIYFYFIGNLIRDFVWRRGFGISYLKTAIIEFNYDYIVTTWNYLASHMFGRIGFLDYSTRMIKFASRYDSLFNVGRYLQVFFDNIIPGNYFNAVKTSTGIGYIDAYGTIPTQYEYMQSGYSSNAITIFGEFYNLGGGLIIGALIIVPTMLLIFRIFSFFLKRATTLLHYNIIMILAFSFYGGILNTFGLDWALETLFMNLVFYSLFKRYYV